MDDASFCYCVYVIRISGFFEKLGFPIIQEYFSAAYVRKPTTVNRRNVVG